MSNAVKWILAVLVIGLVVVGIVGATDYDDSNEDAATIGVVSPLTGDSAYWGESTQIGATLAERDLQDAGVSTNIIIEDGQLDSQTALSAAQKLVNVDNVDAIYSEFNPAAIAITSFLQGRDLTHFYNAAITSPLEDSENTIKSYLDYRSSCRAVANVLQDRGIERVGMLKINLEFGDLCLESLRDVYGEDQVVVSEYNPGNTDFRTQLNQLESENVGAILNPAFNAETVSTIRQINELGIDSQLVVLQETLTEEVVAENEAALEGVLVFGLPQVSDAFKARVDEVANTENYQPAALAYLHLTQIANGLANCDVSEANCVVADVTSSESDPIIGFQGFQNRIAQFETLIQEFQDDEFVEVGTPIPAN